MLIRADHNRFTSEQIFGHEAAHDRLAKAGAEQKTRIIAAARQKLADVGDKVAYEALAEFYEDAYSDSNLTDEELWEEIVCDIEGGMNWFADERGELMQLAIQDVKGVVESATVKTTEGVPEGKASREITPQNNKTNLSKGESVNEQQGQGSRILEGRVLSAVDESKNNQRSRSDDSRTADAHVARNGIAHKNTPGSTDSKRNRSGYLSRHDIVSQSDFDRYKESVLRGLEGKLATRDSSGRSVPEEIREKFKNTVLKNEKGELLSVFHWTPKIFEIFAYGDIGFHFGTYEAALGRRTGKSEQLESDIVKDAYVNIRNPIFLEDRGCWDAYSIATQLFSRGLISYETLSQLSRTKGYLEEGYSLEATKAIRKILSDLNYDGIIYQNAIEGQGMSVAALYPDQIYTVSEETVNGNKGKASRELDLIDYVNEKADGEEYKPLTNRELLASALESVAEDAGERKILESYNAEVKDLNRAQARLDKVGAELKELIFEKGAKDKAAIERLTKEKNDLLKKINKSDKRLLKIEAMEPVKAVMEQEKKKAYKKAAEKGREALHRNVEGRHKTAGRHKVLKVVKELDSYLRTNSKDKHVPIELQRPVAAALDAINMDTVDAEARIKKMSAIHLQAPIKVLRQVI